MQTLMAMIFIFLLGSTVACAGSRAKVVTRNDLKVGAKPTLVVESDCGNVELVTGAAGAVNVEAEREADSEDKARKLQVSATVEGNVVRVQFHKAGGAGANDQVGFRITAPADTRLEIRTGAGNVEARAFAGGMELETKAGNIKVDGATGAVKLRSAAGTFTARRLDGSIDAVTGGGDLRVEGALSGKNRVETGGGTMHVAIPATSKLVVNAYTGGGTVRNDFGLPTKCGQGSCTWRGTLGDGSGGSLDLRSGGGPIVIGKLGDASAAPAPAAASH